MSFSRSVWFSTGGGGGGGGGEYESDEEEIQDEQIRERPDAICYLVECSTSMLATTPHLDNGAPVDADDEGPDDDDDDGILHRSNVSAAIKSALDLMRTRIISGNPRDVVGVVLYDTVRAKGLEGELSKPGVYLLLEPQVIQATNIKLLMETLEEAESDPQSFQKRFAPIDSSVQSTQLIDAMRFCETLLKNRSANLSNRALYLFTDKDDPFQGNQMQQSVAHVFANDAHESGFAIKTFFLPVDAQSFDLGLFWDRFRFDRSIDVEMDNASLIFGGRNRHQMLLELSGWSGRTKRAMWSVPLYLWDGIALGVTGYAAVSEQKKRPPVDVEAAEQLREVYHKVSYTDRATGQELLDPKKDIVKYAAVGPKGKDEQRIEFDPEEVLKIKNLGMGPSLKLLGFMPRAQVKPQHTHKHSYLIYPNETQYANSIPAFAALLKTMLKKDIVGLGVLVARSNSTPVVVYMLPQAEIRDPETDVQVDPPCIWLIQISFADDMREPRLAHSLSAKVASTVPVSDNDDDVEMQGDVDNGLIAECAKLVSKLKIQYKPNQLENPVLQHHYKSLAAHALSEDDPIPVDLTEPDAPVIAERVGKCVKNIKRLLGEHPQLSNTTWNRTRTASGALADEADDQPKPRVSQAKPALEIGRLEAQLVKEFANYRETGKTSLTNDKLKDYLKQKGIPKTSAMKKAELLIAAEEQLIKDGKLSKAKSKEKKEKKKRRVSEDSDDE